MPFLAYLTGHPGVVLHAYQCTSPFLKKVLRNSETAQAMISLGLPPARSKRAEAPTQNRGTANAPLQGWANALRVLLRIS